LAVGGCSSQQDPAAVGPARYRGEYRTMALAAALEIQAVSVYRELLAGRATGSGPASAFVRLAETCVREHEEHAAAWNAILVAGHEPAVTGVPQSRGSLDLKAARSAATPGEAIALVLRLEVQAAQAYVSVAGTLSSAPGVALAASIAPVEAMHTAMLRFMAGEYPAPASFFPGG
jgi:rubrerythrin